MVLSENRKFHTVDKVDLHIGNRDIDAKLYYRAIIGRIDAVYQTNMGDTSNAAKYDVIFSGKRYVFLKEIVYFELSLN